MYFCDQSISTAQGSHISHCLGWSCTSRWENAAAGGPRPSSHIAPLCPSLPPSGTRSCAFPCAPGCSALALACPPKGLSGSRSCSWKPKRGPILPRNSVCRLQGAGYGSERRLAWPSPGAASGEAAANKASPSACSHMEQDPAMQRWPYSPLPLNV